MKLTKTPSPTPAQVVAMKREASAARYPEMARRFPNVKTQEGVAELVDIGVSPAFALAYLCSE